MTANDQSQPAGAAGAPADHGGDPEGWVLEERSARAVDALIAARSTPMITPAPDRVGAEPPAAGVETDADVAGSGPAAGPAADPMTDAAAAPELARAAALLGLLEPLPHTPAWIADDRTARHDATFLAVLRAAERGAERGLDPAAVPAETEADAVHTGVAAPAGTPDFVLAPADRVAIDRWVGAAATIEPDREPAGPPQAGPPQAGPPEAEFAEAELTWHDRLAGVLAEVPEGVIGTAADERARRIEATLAAVAAADTQTVSAHAAPAEAMGPAGDGRGALRGPWLDPEPAGLGSSGGSGGRLRWSDLVAAAAVLLLTAGVLIPMLDRARGLAQRAACENHLHQATLALSSYTDDFDGSLPIATAGFSGPWHHVGTPGESNSANLYTLVRNGYETLETLACPANPAAPLVPAIAEARDWAGLEEISYSYQVMTPELARLARHRPDRPILADRSPVWIGFVQGREVSPFANSPNHAGTGQNVLRVDGSTAWRTHSVTEAGDSLWMPARLQQRILGTVRIQPGRVRVVIRREYTGTELPAGVDDVLLGP